MSPYWLRRIDEVVSAIASADDWIGTHSLRYEVAVVHPLRLDEFELPSWICVNESQDDAAILPVILRGVLGQHGSVGRATSQQAVQPSFGHRVLKSIAWIDTPDVTAYRSLLTVQVVFEIREVVVTLGIGDDRRIVGVGRERKGTPTAPAAHHLRRNLFLPRVIRCG